ncbi:MAG: sigma factor [Melioribacteraceae bacterium]
MTVDNTNYVEYLIELSKEGRKRSFIDLCEINLRNVYTIAYRLLSNAEEAQKVTIHTFVKSWERIKEYNENIPFSIWMKNTAIEYSIRMLGNRDANYAERKRPIKISSEQEFLESHILSLPQEERIIIILHDIEGYSYNEIRNFFEGLEINEIKSKLVNTREYLINKISV